MTRNLDFTPIEKPPGNLQDYTHVGRVDGDKGLDFIKNLAALLRRGARFISTPVVPEDWIVIALIGSEANGRYQVWKQPAPDPAREQQGDHGVFYLDRKETERPTPGRRPSRVWSRWLRLSPLLGGGPAAPPLAEKPGN